MDDEVVMGSVMRRIFAASYDVTVVQSGRAALGLIDGGADFDVVLCDVVMPDLSGPQVYDAVCANHPHLAPRFAFITGGAVQEKNRAFLASVRSRVLQKPFELSAVRELVRRVGADPGSG